MRRSTIFNPPVSMPLFSAPNNSQLVDVNGDGLQDWVYSDGGNTYVLLNTGTGWESSPSSQWTIATSTFYTVPNSSPTTYYDRGMRFIDVNGDELPDFVRSYSMPCTVSGSWAPSPEFCSYNWVMYNTGSGWAPPVPYTLPVAITTGQIDSSGWWTGTQSFREYANFQGNGQQIQDIISKVNYSQGGSSDISYGLSTQLSGAGSNNLPYDVVVVTKIVNHDGQGSNEETDYSYGGGKQYLPTNVRDRKFAGFATVTKADSGSKTVTYYNQGGPANPSIGNQSDGYAQINHPFRTDSFDSTGQSLQRQVFDRWDATSTPAGLFVYKAREVEQDYGGGSAHRDMATDYAYASSTGNLTQAKHYGEVTGNSDGTFTDIGNDLYTTTISYATNASSTAVSFPSDEVTTNQSGTQIKETRHNYDGLTLGSVSAGNETKTDAWITGSTYASTTNAYNSYGLVATSTDADGNATGYTYDSYNLYPASATNAKNQTTSYLYNYSNGKPKQTTDSNGLVYQSVYDGVGRVTQQLQPDLNTPSTLVTKATYTYVNGAVPQSVQETDSLDGSTTHSSYTYSDGLSRTIQTRSQSENAGTYSIKDTVYNTAGLVQKESLPYFASGSAWAAPTSTTALFTSYTYDGLQRPLTITNAVGVTTNAYTTPWKVTTTDPKGNVKDYTKDAYGNLVQVVEHNGSSLYTTAYTYDGLKNLLNLTDANGNVRNFTYDGVGRRLTAQDLHASSAPTFGTYTYTYDAAGNLLQKVDPKSQTISYAYDQLNRPLTESLASTTQVTYTYDSCTYGIGRLCVASSTAELTTYTYNPLGGKASEALTLAGTTTPYTTSYTYNRQGSPLVITNPNGAQINYTYNAAGLTSVANRTMGTSTTPIATLNGYAPTNQFGNVSFASGATTTYTYDPTALYRLTRILTQSTTTSAGTSTSSLLSNTMGYWKFDGNSTDATNNGNNGADTAITYGALYGKVNQGASYNGSTSDIYLGTRMNTGTNQVSACAWINPGALSADTSYAIVANGDGVGPATSAYGMYIRGTGSNTARLQMTVPDSSNGYGYNTTGIVTFTGWTHLCFVYDHTNYKFYVNGSLFETSGSFTQSMNQPTNVPTDIGTAVHGAYYQFKGSMDEVGLWNRALSGTEVSQLYNSSNGLQYPFQMNTSFPNTQDLNYTYDADNNILTRTDNSSTGGGQLVNYGYDALNRLTSASTTGATSTAPAYNQTFTYDALGNLLTGPTGSYTYAGTSNANPDAVTQTQITLGATAPTIAYDNSTLAGNGVNASSLTFSHTSNATTSSGVIIVGVQESTGGSCAADTVTSVSYNGVALSDMGYYTSASSSGTALKTYYGFAPAQGAHNVVVSASASCIRYVVATTYSGVKQSGFPDASGTGNPLADSGSVTSLQANTTLSYNAWPVLIGVPSASNGLSTNLTAYWSLDGTTNDASGGGNTLTNTGSVSLTNTGIIGNAAGMFNSSSRLGMSTNTGFTKAGAHTWSGWVKFSALGSYVFDNITTSGAAQRVILYSDATNKRLIVYANSTDGVVVTPNNSINLNTWYFYTVTWNNQTVQLYLNGVLQGSNTVGGTSSALDTFALGNASDSFGAPLNGYIDEAGVWNRVLSGSDITQLYNNGAGLSYGSFGGGGGIASSTATTTIRQQQQGNLVYADSNGALPQGASTLTLTTQNPTHWSANYFSIPPLTSNPGTTYTTSYNYDANGNLTGTTQGATTTTYTWDYNNRMLSSSGTGLPSLSYVYDPSGARFSQTGATSTTIYPSKFYSVTISGANSTSTEYVYAGDTLIATIDQAYTNGTATGSSTIRFIHTDNLGSTQATTDMSGNVVQSLSYAPYGSVLASTGSGLKRQYIDQFADSSGLDYLNARYLQSDRGQFLSEDPVFWGTQNLADPQSLNSYGYANGNPVVNKDPQGLWALRVGVSGTIPGWGLTGEIGIQMDFKGVEYYYGGGLATGGGISFGPQVTTADLSHQYSISTAAFVQVAPGVSIERSKGMTSYPYSKRKAETYDEASFGIPAAGASAGGIAEVSGPIPFLTRSGNPTTDDKLQKPNMVGNITVPQSRQGGYSQNFNFSQGGRTSAYAQALSSLQNALKQLSVVLSNYKPASH